MLLRLSRLSLWLAAAAAGLALFGPLAQRELCSDIALALGGAAFVLWRGALAMRRRIERGADAVPDAMPLDAAALAAVEALVVRVASAAPDLETALQRSAETLRGELGARAARVFLVADRDGVAGVCELIATQPAFCAPRRAPTPGETVLGLALRERRVCIDLPHGVALPVLGGGRAIALLELVGIEMPVDEEALASLLAATADALAARAASAATARVASGAPLRGAGAALHRASAEMGVAAGAPA
mgnify:CR=1 FL=1